MQIESDDLELAAEVIRGIMTYLIILTGLFDFAEGVHIGTLAPSPSGGT
jgi:hypothetical protein